MWQTITGTFGAVRLPPALFNRNVSNAQAIAEARGQLRQSGIPAYEPSPSHRSLPATAPKAAPGSALTYIASSSAPPLKLAPPQKSGFMPPKGEVRRKKKNGTTTIYVEEWLFDTLKTRYRNDKEEKFYDGQWMPVSGGFLLPPSAAVPDTDGAMPVGMQPPSDEDTPPATAGKVATATADAAAAAAAPDAAQQAAPASAAADAEDGEDAWMAA